MYDENSTAAISLANRFASTLNTTQLPLSLVSDPFACTKHPLPVQTTPLSVAGRKTPLFPDPKFRSD